MPRRLSVYWEEMQRPPLLSVTALLTARNGTASESARAGCRQSVVRAFIMITDCIYGAVDATSGSWQCATDSQLVRKERVEENAENIKSTQECKEPSKKPNTTQGNRRKHKQKQRKQKREAEQNAAVAAAAVALATASASEGFTYDEDEKTEERHPDDDVTRKESSQHSEIVE